MDAAELLEAERGEAELLDVDIPPALEGVPRTISVSVLARQGDKVHRDKMDPADTPSCRRLSLLGLLACFLQENALGDAF